MGSNVENPKPGLLPFPQAESGVVCVGTCSGSFVPPIPHGSPPAHIADDPLGSELGAVSTTSFSSPNTTITPTFHGGRPVVPPYIPPSRGPPTSGWPPAAPWHESRYEGGARDTKFATNNTGEWIQQPTNGENGGMGSFHAAGEGYGRSYFKIHASLSHSSTVTDGDRAATQIPSVYPPLRPAINVQNASIPANGIVRSDAGIGSSEMHVLQQQDRQSFDCAPSQPVHLFQQARDVRRAVMSLEGQRQVVGVEAGTQLICHAVGYSHIPNIPVIEADASSASRAPYGQEGTGPISGPSENARNSMGQDAPRHLTFSQGEGPVWMHEFNPEAPEVLTETYDELGSLPSTDARLDRPNWACTPAFICPSGTPLLGATTETNESGVTVQSDVQPPAAKDERSRSGVQRTGRHRRKSDVNMLPYAKRKPHTIFESDLGKLQDRCREGGGDEAVVNRLPAIFKDGVSAEALSRQMTEQEINQHVFGEWPRRTQVYRALLGRETNGTSIHHHTCRLCREGTRWPYRNAKDVLQHIKRCHVGCEGNKSQ
jgi:hypothetical protein